MKLAHWLKNLLLEPDLRWNQLNLNRREKGWYSPTRLRAYKKTKRKRKSGVLTKRVEPVLPAVEVLRVTVVVKVQHQLRKEKVKNPREICLLVVHSFSCWLWVCFRVYLKPVDAALGLEIPDNSEIEHLGKIWFWLNLWTDLCNTYNHQLEVKLHYSLKKSNQWMSWFKNCKKIGTPEAQAEHQQTVGQLQGGVGTSYCGCFLGNPDEPLCHTTKCPKPTQSCFKGERSVASKSLRSTRPIQSKTVQLFGDLIDEMVAAMDHYLPARMIEKEIWQLMVLSITSLVPKKKLRPKTARKSRICLHNHECRYATSSISYLTQGNVKIGLTWMAQIQRLITLCLHLDTWTGCA